MRATSTRPREDVLDVFLALLSESDLEVDSHAPSSAFYNRLCEAVCNLTALERAALFLYDDARDRVRAVGVHGVDPATVVAIDVTLEEAPLAQRALAEDRVLEASGNLEEDLPARYVRSLGLTTVVCVPLSAAGRWLGVLFVDLGGDAFTLSPGERDLLWSLGKTAALAATARIATREQEHARRLNDRLELARDVHASVVQRLFALTAVLQADADLTAAERKRCGDELQRALDDLRRAIQRPLDDGNGQPDTTVRAEIERVKRANPERIEVTWPERVSVPDHLESLAQSVLGEALRNVQKHASPTKIQVIVGAGDGTFTLEVRNDGVDRRTGRAGVGLRLAALEALEHGGVVEFGPVDVERWRVRLLVPLED